MFSFSLFDEQLRRLPDEIIAKICFYPDPFPELVAIVYTMSVAIRYRERRAPSWIDLQHIKVGTTFYMSFSNFEGRTYLTEIKIKPCATSSKALVAQDELLICRDHFAIQNIYGSADRPGNLEARGQSVFYHTINLRQVGSKELTIRGFSDGLFIRSLIPLGGPRRVVEWNTLPSSLPGSTYWFSKQVNPQSSFNRCEYHDLSNISGLSPIVHASRTIGVFCHRQGSTMNFKTYAAQFEMMYPRLTLLFLFFPINQGEKIQAIAVRQIPDLRFPTNTPVIQIATDRGRTYSFGPHPQNESLYEYECLRSSGAIQGLFYFSPGGRISPGLSDIGVTTSSRCDQIQKVNLSPGENLPCPSLASPNQGWCYSKAQLEIDVRIQLCKTSERDGTCIGVLLTYPDGSKEALGQVRFDKHLSESVNAQDCWFCNEKIDGKLSVLIRSPSDNYEYWRSTQYRRFTTAGKVVWWCGRNGNQIELYD